VIQTEVVSQTNKALVPSGTATFFARHSYSTAVYEFPLSTSPPLRQISWVMRFAKVKEETA
jgi:hypothetical protein